MCVILLDFRDINFVFFLAWGLVTLLDFLLFDRWEEVICGFVLFLFLFICRLFSVFLVICLFIFFIYYCRGWRLSGNWALI